MKENKLGNKNRYTKRQIAADRQTDRRTHAETNRMTTTKIFKCKTD